MSTPTGIIWSNTDYPYLCLVDRKRTLAFRAAIEQTVRPGDVVVEVGAGTGILSLFAAAAGAARVLAVEIDPVLARTLRETVQANGYADVIEVVEGDALGVDLPHDVDVVIAELVETALLDEMQVAVVNGLHERGVVGPGTRLVPQTYRTGIRLAHTDNTFYGFVVSAPKHEWPYYAEDPAAWEHLRVEPLSEVVTVCELDFRAGVVDPVVDRTVTLRVPDGAQANAVVLSGSAGLSEEVVLGAANSFSGDKVLPLTPCRGEVTLRVRYEMGRGLDNLSLEVL